jgi:hypothetical protein
MAYINWPDPQRGVMSCASSIGAVMIEAGGGLSASVGFCLAAIGGEGRKLL